MSTSLNAHIRVAFTLFIVVLLLTFARSPAMLEASHMEEEFDTLAAVPASYAWVTSYDDEGGYNDITYVAFGTEPGYGTELSTYVGHVVGTFNDSYVLNWRPNNLGSNLQLCGLRVAYRLPLSGGGFATAFSYAHIAGSVLRPRNSTSEWANDGSGGCIYLTAGNTSHIFNIHLEIPNGSRIDYLRAYYFRRAVVYLPLVMRNY